ncbi:ATP-binding protein [Chitinophaga sp.]|uniref:ATP-binding protein n=1 Tax=Chitinophaga sp. TaxID=1869181 RepID=UPI0031E0A1A5
MDNSIVPAHLAVKAMRDNGYKNAAYAIAELIDNSIQHGAKLVELLCSEIEVQFSSRTVRRINKIAVLDNGKGMNKDILRMALQFGNGTNLEPSNQKGIGKFGMGLPSSSVSQAKRVEVWTWQDGIEGAIYTFLDIDQIINREMKDVPEPTSKAIPELWKSAGSNFDKTGTLVVWSNIDRCIWKTAQSIIDNSEFLIGRMYRKYIDEETVSIKMVAFNENNPTRPYIIKTALPNDPLYLMSKTSCPEPYNDKPMFNKWGGEDYEVKYTIPFKGEKHYVFLRFTLAKEEARKGFNPGSRPYGKHAAKNIGVSIIRSNRELDLDQAWAIQYDPVERWWGIEIEFPPALDEVFGVTNNKQFANNFSDLGKFGLEDLVKDGKTLVQLKEELQEEGDPKALLIEITERIESSLGTIRKLLRAQTKNEERTVKKRYEDQNSAEKKATEATAERIKEGHKGTSDIQEEQESENERKENVEASLESEGIGNATELTDWLFKSNLKYSFVEADIESHAFFTVKTKGGKILISLNTNHPAYKNLVEVLESSTEGVTSEDLMLRLRNASDGLKLLLMAWARYEDEQADGPLKNRAQDTRQDWGRIAKQFLQED